MSEAPPTRVPHLRRGLIAAKVGASTNGRPLSSAHPKIYHFERSAAKSRNPRSLFVLALLLAFTSCHRPADPTTATIIIESSPNNLDLRIGTDAQSERVGALIFDALVKKAPDFTFQPWLAESWSQPDPLTLIFKIRTGVQFHNGQPLTSRDVAYSIDSMHDGSLITSKSGNFANVDHTDAPDPSTVIVHLKHPDSGLLFNLSDGLFGVVPFGTTSTSHTFYGSGTFKFASQVQDKEVLLDRNDHPWTSIAKIPHLKFNIIPDNITAALEMKKGSADIASNVLTLDEIHSLEGTPNLKIESAPGSFVYYMNFNLEDPALRNKAVRQAIALSIDRTAIINAIWRGEALPASTLLPKTHWAASNAPPPPFNPQAAQSLLESAGFHADAHGTRLHLTIKTSTDETTRMLAAVLQQQLRAAGIALDIRSAEFGTFYADITHGIFQLYVLKWIGSNEDPDIFRYAYSTASFPPKGSNRGHFTNAQLDSLLNQAAAEPDQQKRRAIYLQAQQILADELPSVPLWYPNNEIVHTSRITHVVPNASGNFDFLREAEIIGH